MGRASRAPGRPCPEHARPGRRRRNFRAPLFKSGEAEYVGDMSVGWGRRRRRAPCRSLRRLCGLAATSIVAALALLAAPAALATRSRSRPQADTFVSRCSSRIRTYGTSDFLDTYGGFNTNCVPAVRLAPAYGAAALRARAGSRPAASCSTRASTRSTRAGYRAGRRPEPPSDLPLQRQLGRVDGDLDLDGRSISSPVATGDPTLAVFPGGDIRASVFAARLVLHVPEHLRARPAVEPGPSVPGCCLDGGRHQVERGLPRRDLLARSYPSERAGRRQDLLRDLQPELPDGLRGRSEHRVLGALLEPGGRRPDRPAEARRQVRRRRRHDLRAGSRRDRRDGPVRVRFRNDKASDLDARHGASPICRPASPTWPGAPPGSSRRRRASTARRPRLEPDAAALAPGASADARSRSRPPTRRAPASSTSAAAPASTRRTSATTCDLTSTAATDRRHGGSQPRRQRRVEAGTDRLDVFHLPLDAIIHPPSSPITQQPITQQPITQQPITQQPITQQPISQQPISQMPITQFGFADAASLALLGDVTLDTLPTTIAGGWPAVLAGHRARAGAAAGRDAAAGAPARRPAPAVEHRRSSSATSTAR